MTDKEKIRKEVEKLHGNPYYMMAVKDVLAIIDSLQEEHVSENLLKASMEFAKHFGEWHYAIQCFQAGANWQKNHLWKLADGDDLPEIDREVIALIRMDGFFQIPPDEPVEMTYKVVFAHRPNPDGCDGKSITTGNIEHYTPMTYGKGGWNIPDIKYWLDVELPKEIEL